MSFGFERQILRGKSLDVNSFDAYQEARVLRSGKGSNSSTGKGSKASKSSKSPKSTKGKGSESLSSKDPKSGKGKGSESLSSKMPKSGKGKGSKSLSSKIPKSGKGKGGESLSSKSKGSLRGSDSGDDSFDCTTSEGRNAAIRRIVEDISESITEGSPQDSALSWLLEDTYTDACDVEQVTERYALATLYFATEGADWEGTVGNENWLEPFDVCTAWVGIICKNNRVQRIELRKCLDIKSSSTLTIQFLT